MANPRESQVSDIARSQQSYGIASLTRKDRSDRYKAGVSCTCICIADDARPAQGHVHLRSMHNLGI